MSKSILIADIVFHLQSVFDGKPWYGRNVKRIMEEIRDDDQVAKAIISHMLVWREFTLESIHGKDINIEIDSEDDWPASDTLDLAEALTRMNKNNQAIVDSIKYRPDSWLNETVKGKSYNFQFLLEGIIQHDIYHAGQLAFINKQHKNRIL